MQQMGKQSLRFDDAEAPFIISSASVVGKKEGEGPLGAKFDAVGDDDKFGQETWEEAESSLQKDALTLALGKAHLAAEDIRYLFAGDLLGQSMASSFGVMDFRIPLFCLYGACSTCGEALSLAAVSVASGCADRVAVVTSSHFASAEKQFRFPLEYANQRPLSATWTVTGGGAYILAAPHVVSGKLSGDGSDGGSDDGVEEVCGNLPGRETGEVRTLRSSLSGSETDENGEFGNGRIRITGITTGKIVDYGIKDAMNMGAAMAPAACDLIARHFEDFGCGPEAYDKIITGDLGAVGREILLDLMRQKGYEIGDRHEDCGMKIYDGKMQGTGSGGSGCGCSAVTLSAHYLNELKNNNLKRILFIPTGALLSPVSFNEGKSVPGIAHGVVIERS